MAKRPVHAVTLLLAGVAAFSLSACIIVDNDGDNLVEWDSSSDYGSIRGASVAGDTITVRVSSNGCTTQDFIRADVSPHGDDRFTVGFARVKQDYCRALLPDGVELTWTFAELGIPSGASVKVRNPIAN